MPSKGSLRVRQLRGALTFPGRDADTSSCRHRSGSLGRNRSKLSPRGVGLSSGDTMAARADWASLMVCHKTTGSNADRV